MKKSIRVTLTVVAAIGCAAPAGAQDPCEPASFSRGACRIAIHDAGYCSGGAWVSSPYPQSYAYYYDRYRGYLSQAGTVTPATVASCGLLTPLRYGGFGAHGALLARQSGG
jgi:hypothetical protein